jgi:hypothetical protein
LVENVGFFLGNKLLSENESLQTLLSATSATLKITNQKMGTWVKPYINRSFNAMHAL